MCIVVFPEIFLFGVKAGDFLNSPRISLREAFSLTMRYGIRLKPGIHAASEPVSFLCP